MNDLLKVLDMSEEEQIEWLIEKGITDGSLARSQVTNKKIVKHWIRIELADLAFRFRDEVESKVEFHHCFAKVCKHIDPHIMNYAGYALCTAKPIHWIIAALMAKQGL